MKDFAEEQSAKHGHDANADLCSEEREGEAGFCESIFGVFVDQLKWPVVIDIAGWDEAWGQSLPRLQYRGECPRTTLLPVVRR